MEFLKAVLGEELFNQFSEKVNAYNDDEANKDKLIKLVNLSEGGYVSTDKYSSLETDFKGKDAELEKATGLIEELKKASGQDEGIQQKITGYETEITALKKENENLRTENALRFALEGASAVDVDYLLFKAKEKGEVKLGDDGKVKGIDELITGLKTQFPKQFETKQQTKVDPIKLPDNPDPAPSNEATTLAGALKAAYNTPKE
ncbi:MAG: phage scaffolding protein [Muricomes sp.]